LHIKYFQNNLVNSISYFIFAANECMLLTHKIDQMRNKRFGFEWLFYNDLRSSRSQIKIVRQ